MPDALIALFELILNTSGNVMLAIIIFLAVCGIALAVKRYGSQYLKIMCAKRNWMPLALLFIFTSIFVAMCYSGILSYCPVGLVICLRVCYFTFFLAVLFSMDKPIGISKWYLSKYKKLLHSGNANELPKFIKKKPWFILDDNEKFAYYTLKAGYHANFLDIKGAYDTLENIQPQWMLPQELAETTISKAYLLVQMGNTQKADDLVEAIQDTDYPGYAFIKSLVLETSGDIEGAYMVARKGEDRINRWYRNIRVKTALYNMLGRLECFRDNETEMFRYFRMAINEAKELKDVSQYHVVYQNYIKQILLRGKHRHELEHLIAEYTSLVEGDSLSNITTMLDFRVLLARLRNDREEEYNVIISGYRHLKQRLQMPQLAVCQVTALEHLRIGGYPIDEVFDDMRETFASYFSLEMPYKINVMSMLQLPNNLNDEQVVAFNKWGEQLADYANSTAISDLEKYEQTLSSSNVAERCWVLMQKVNFTKGGTNKYDGIQVLQWLKEARQIYQDHGLLQAQMEMNIRIIKEHFDQFDFEIRKEGLEDSKLIYELWNEADGNLQKISVVNAPYLYVDSAYIGILCKEFSRTKAAWNKFKMLNWPGEWFPKEIQDEIAVIKKDL